MKSRISFDKRKGAFLIEAVQYRIHALFDRSLLFPEKFAANVRKYAKVRSQKHVSLPLLRDCYLFDIKSSESL